MNDDTARELLAAERSRVQALLDSARAAGRDDRGAASEQGDMTDPAPALVSEQVDDALAVELSARLEAIARAEQRLGTGTYGRSVRSGLAISDDRLHADPAAELTIEEARHSA